MQANRRQIQVRNVGQQLIRNRDLLNLNPRDRDDMEQLFNIVSGVRYIAFRVGERVLTVSQGGRNYRIRHLRSPTIIIEVPETPNEFYRTINSTINRIKEDNDYDEFDAVNVNDLYLTEVRKAEQRSFGRQSYQKKLRNFSVQAKHQAITEIEGYCIQKLKAQFTLSCLQESLAIIFFYKLNEEDIQRLIYQSTEQWVNEVYILMNSFDEELFEQMYTEQPYIIIPQFNRWLKTKNINSAVGIYNVVINEVDLLGNSEEEVQNFIGIFRQHAYPLNKVGVKMLMEERNKQQKKCEDRIDRGQLSSDGEVVRKREPSSIYALKSLLLQYENDIESGKYPKYEYEVNHGMSREIAHQKKLKLCFQLPDETNLMYRQRLVDWINYRQKKFNFYCELGVDCETYTDNKMGEEGKGNQVPFLVCYAGVIQRQLENGNVVTDNYIIDVTLPHEELIEQAKKQSFWGRDCWKDFVRWIKTNGYYQTGYIGNRVLDIGGEKIVGHKKRIRNGNQHQSRIKNFIVAHNGGRFDYGYLISYMAQYIGVINVIGTQAQIKGFSCGNIWFYDSILIHKASLAELCQMFLEEKDWKKNIGDIVIDREGFENMSDERKDQFIYYCFFDAHSVRLVHQKQFQGIFSRPFGRGFFQNNVNKSPFIHSAASLSLSIFANQFLEKDLKVFPLLSKMERLSMRGGHTQVYRPKMGLGFCADIKSSYPTSMYNLMPYKPKTQDMTIVKDSQFKDFENYDLLAVDYYKFPEDVLYPGVAIKVSDQDVNKQFDIVAARSWSSETQLLFLWGVEVKLMRKQGARVNVVGHLAYEPYPIFKSYIKKMFGIRQAWGENGEVIKYYTGQMEYDQLNKYAQEQVDQTRGDFFKSEDELQSFRSEQNEQNRHVQKKINLFRKTTDRTCKLLMNSLFGKTGQKNYDQYYCGLPEDVYEKAFEKLLYQHDRLDSDIFIQTIPDYNTPLMELTYKQRGQEVETVGGLVRFASYITAISRCNLMEKLEMIRECIGPHRVYYCDTDCICIGLGEDDDRINRKQRELYERALRNQGDENQMKQIGVELVDLIKGHPEFQKLKSMKVRDFRKLHEEKWQDFVETEKEILGTFQIEKFILECRFLGSKAYCGFMNFNGFQQVIKVKGVKILDFRKASRQQITHDLFMEKVEVCKRFCEAHEAYIQGDYERCGFIVNSMSNFERIGTMTSVSVKQKICCHSLIKRLNFRDPLSGECLTFPHQTVEDFYVYKKEHEELKKKIKTFIQFTHNEEIIKYMEDESNIAIQQAKMANQSLLKMNVRQNVFGDIMNMKFDDIPEAVIQLYNEGNQAFFTHVRASYQIIKNKIANQHKIIINAQLTPLDEFYVDQVASAKILINFLKISGKSLGFLTGVDYRIEQFMKFDERLADAIQYKLLKKNGIQLKAIYEDVKRIMNYIPTQSKICAIGKGKDYQLIEYQKEKNSKILDKIEKEFKIWNILNDQDYQNMRLMIDASLSPQKQMKDIIERYLPPQKIQQLFGVNDLKIELRDKQRTMLKCIQRKIYQCGLNKVQVQMKKYEEVKNDIANIQKYLDKNQNVEEQNKGFIVKHFTETNEQFAKMKEYVGDYNFDESIIDMINQQVTTYKTQLKLEKKQKVYVRQLKKRGNDQFLEDLEKEVKREVDGDQINQQ